MIEQITDPAVMALVENTPVQRFSTGDRALVTGAYSDAASIGRVVPVDYPQSARWPITHDYRDYTGARVNEAVEVGDRVIALHVSNVTAAEGKPGTVRSRSGVAIRVDMDEPCRNNDGYESSSWEVESWVKAIPQPVTPQTDGPQEDGIRIADTYLYGGFRTDHPDTTVVGHILPFSLVEQTEDTATEYGTYYRFNTQQTEAWLREHDLTWRPLPGSRAYYARGERTPYTPQARQWRVGDRVEVTIHDGNAQYIGHTGVVTEVGNEYAGRVRRLGERAGHNSSGLPRLGVTVRMDQPVGTNTICRQAEGLRLIEPEPDMVPVSVIETVRARYRSHTDTGPVDRLARRLTHGGHKVQTNYTTQMHEVVDGENKVIAAFANARQAEAFLATKVVTEVPWPMVERLVRATGRDQSWCSVMEQALDAARPRREPVVTRTLVVEESASTTNRAVRVNSSTGLTTIVRTILHDNGDVEVAVNGNRVYLIPAAQTA